MLSPVIARELCARGHDVEALAGHPEREALSDPDVLALARAERRAVVTNNSRDFRPLHVEAVLPGGPGHCGMIFMPGTYRRTRNDIGRIVAALEAKLRQYPDQEALVNAEEWLKLHHAVVVLGVGGSSPLVHPMWSSRPGRTDGGTSQTARATPWTARSRPSASAVVRFLAFDSKLGTKACSPIGLGGNVSSVCIVAAA